MPGDCSAGTVAVDGGAGRVAADGRATPGGGAPGGSPCAVAVFRTAPASTFAWVVTKVAVHVSPAPGASDGCGQLTADRPRRPASVTPMPVSVTFPVLVAAQREVTVCPAPLNVDGDADFTTEIPGVSAVLVNVHTTVGEAATVTGNGRVNDCPVPEATTALPLAVSAHE